MHTCCVLSRFLLHFKDIGLEEVNQLNALWFFIMHFSKVVYKEPWTRSFNLLEKTKLQQSWQSKRDHKVVAVNIVLFLFRRGYITLLNTRAKNSKEMIFRWKLDIVHAAIREQIYALNLLEDDSGAWILSNFLESPTACHTLSEHPENMPSNAFISEAMMDM